MVGAPIKKEVVRMFGWMFGCVCVFWGQNAHQGLDLGQLQRRCGSWRFLANVWCKRLAAPSASIPCIFRACIVCLAPDCQSASLADRVPQVSD